MWNPGRLEPLILLDKKIKKNRFNQTTIASVSQKINQTRATSFGRPNEFIKQRNMEIIRHSCSAMIIIKHHKSQVNDVKQDLKKWIERRVRELRLRESSSRKTERSWAKRSEAEPSRWERNGDRYFEANPVSCARITASLNCRKRFLKCDKSRFIEIRALGNSRPPAVAIPWYLSPFAETF